MQLLIFVHYSRSICLLHREKYKKKKKLSTAEVRHCRNPGLNRGPLDLQSNALPTELFRPTDNTEVTKSPTRDMKRDGVCVRACVRACVLARVRCLKSAPVDPIGVGCCLLGPKCCLGYNLPRDTEK